jgi:hypothetical protein
MSEPEVSITMLTPFQYRLLTPATAGSNQIALASPLTPEPALHSGRLFLAIDAYTGNCEVQAVSGFITTSVIALHSHLAKPHLAGTTVLVLSDPCLTPQMFGAGGTGNSDDTVAIQNAIDVSRAIAGDVEVWFPPGTYLVTHTLTTPPTPSRITLRGTDIGLPSDHFATKIWCKDISGPLLHFAAKPAAVTLIGLEIDGSNGRNTLPFFSTTWTGLWDPVELPDSDGVVSTIEWAFLHISCCWIHCLAVPRVKAVDLTEIFYVLIENTFIQSVAHGWAVYALGSPNETTTVTLRKTYLQYNLECLYVGGVINMDIYDTVFESSLVAICAYDSQLNLTGCYFENLGYWDSSGEGSPAKSPGDYHDTHHECPASEGAEALTLQNMGINDGIACPVDTAMHFRHGNIAFRGCQFLYLYQKGDRKAWVRGVGLGQTWGEYGQVTFDLCRRVPNPQDRLIADETLLATRAGFSFVVNDPVTVYSWLDKDTQAKTVFPGGVVQCNADARSVTSGRVLIVFSLTDMRPVAIENSAFTYGQFPDNSYTAPLSIAPSGGNPAAGTDAPGSNEVGDRVLNSEPAANGSLGWICVAPGNPGTWASYGQIGT